MSRIDLKAHSGNGHKQWLDVERLSDGKVTLTGYVDWGDDYEEFVLSPNEVRELVKALEEEAA